MLTSIKTIEKAQQQLVQLVTCLKISIKLPMPHFKFHHPWRVQLLGAECRRANASCGCCRGLCFQKSFLAVLCPGFNSFCPCFCLLPTEQIFQNLRQEYNRIQRRRQLEGAFNQTEACSSSDAPSPSSSLNAPSSPPGRRIYCWLHTHT